MRWKASDLSDGQRGTALLETLCLRSPFSQPKLVGGAEFGRSKLSLSLSLRSIQILCQQINPISASSELEREIERRRLKIYAPRRPRRLRTSDQQQRLQQQQVVNNY